MTRRIALFLSCAALLAALPAIGAAWDGEMIEEPDGVRVVNTETPAAGEATLETEELWRVGGLDGEMLIGVIGELLHDEQGNVYLLDGQLSEIQVVSPSGEWLRTIGREGEGPGEFRNAADMFWLPSGEIGVTQYWPGKIVTLWPDGTPGAQFSLPYGKGGSLQTASKGQRTDAGIVLSGSAWVQEGDESHQLTYLKAFDQDGQEVAHFHESKRPQAFGNWTFKEARYIDFQRRWAAAPDGRVAAAMHFDQYRITVWNPDGSLDRIIERPGFEPLARTAEEIERFQLVYDRITSWNPGSTFEVDANHQTIGQLFFREDGTLWVQNARDQWRVPDGRFTSYDVYDRQGRFVQRVHLNLDGDAVQDGVYFGGDRLYLVTDLMAAVMSSFGGEGTAEDAEPVSVITYSVSPLDDTLTKAD
jgi:hypothetical protein